MKQISQITNIKINLSFIIISNKIRINIHFISFYDHFEIFLSLTSLTPTYNKINQNF